MAATGTPDPNPGFRDAGIIELEPGSAFLTLNNHFDLPRLSCQ
jgi:hypothetical protein